MRDACKFYARDPHLTDFSYTGHLEGYIYIDISNIHVQLLRLLFLSGIESFRQEGLTRFFVYNENELRKFFKIFSFHHEFKTNTMANDVVALSQAMGWR